MIKHVVIVPFPPAKVLEIYFVLPPDVPKDSSTEATCLLRALDLAHQKLQERGVPLPEHLVIEAGCPNMSKYCLFWFTT